MKCLPIVLLFVSAVVAEIPLGELTTKAHGVGGSLYAKDEHTLVVKNFKYDGQGPDAFFWVGKEGVPSPNGILVPYPTPEKPIEDLKDAPVLKGFDGKEDVTITLPENLKVSDLKWFSVWCRQYSVNFADVFIDQPVLFDKEPEVPKLDDDSVRPPLVEPDNTLDHEHHDKDQDVSAEPEGSYKSDSTTSAGFQVVSLLAALAISNYVL